MHGLAVVAVVAAEVVVAAASMVEAEGVAAEAAPRFVVAEADIAVAVPVQEVAMLGARRRCRIGVVEVVADLRSTFRVEAVRVWGGFRRQVAQVAVPAVDKLRDLAADDLVAGRLRDPAAERDLVAVRDLAAVRDLVAAAWQVVGRRSVTSITF